MWVWWFRRWCLSRVSRYGLPVFLVLLGLWYRIMCVVAFLCVVVVKTLASRHLFRVPLWARLDN